MSDFIKLLLRHKYIIIVLPLITIIITYFLVRNLPDVYVSKSRIATGISDQTENLLNDGGKLEKSEIDQKFANIIQLMLLRQMVDQVSYQLILHDLTSPKPFRPASKLLKQMDAAAKKRAIKVIKEKYDNMADLSLYDKYQYGLNELIASMGYDYETISDKLMVFRANSSDYIDVKYESDQAELSAFVANSLTTEFIAYYGSMVKKNQGKAVDFLTNLLQIKLDTLNRRMLELKNYKTKNRILYLGTQASALFGQIKDYETFKETAEKEILSYTAAIKEIDNKFNPADRKYIEAALTKSNTSIVETKLQLKILNDRYVSSNFDEKYKVSIDSLRNLLSTQITQSSDRYILNPLASKQELISKKLEMEITLDLAKNSLISLDGELSRLNKRFDELVPHEAVIQSNERAIDVASREYLEILTKVNQTNMASSYGVNLRQIEVAMPGSAAPAKRMLLIIISGIVSFVFCIVVFFVIFYLDDDIKVAKQLANKTEIPVLGYLPFLKSSVAEVMRSWNDRQISRNMLEFKDQLRAIRFEIDREMKGDRQLAITGLRQGEGKTMFAIGLAFAYSLTKKRILLIDGNFENSIISQTIQSEFFLEDYLNGSLTLDQLKIDRSITLLANKGGDVSLFELAGEDTIKAKLEALNEVFDFILIECPSVQSLNKAGEWLLVANKMIVVFEANRTISKKMQDQIDYLKSLDNKMIGWVLNKVTIGDIKVKKTNRKTKNLPILDDSGIS